VTITTAGATQQAGATGGGVTSLAVTMGSLAIGDVLVLGSVELLTALAPAVASVVGGGVTTWEQGARSLTFNSASYQSETWYGVITSLTPALVTVNYNEIGGVATARIACQQFHSSLAGSWSLISGGGENSDTLGNAASGTYYNLSASGGQLYFGCGLFNTAAGGASGGFTYINGIGGGTGGAVVWNTAASGTQSPAWTQATSGIWGNCAMLLSAGAVNNIVMIL